MKLPFVIKINFVWVCRMFRKYILKKTIEKRNFGYIRDKWDSRDFYYKVRRPVGLLPPSTNRKAVTEFTWRYNQLNIGSCVGNGISEAYRRILQVNKLPDFDPSRLFAYWISRVDKKEDSGASIRDAFKAVNIYGICHEILWPYVPSKFADLPPDRAFMDAINHQAIKYERIFPVTKDAIRDAVSNGFPVVYGKLLYESFMSDFVARTGIVPLPRTCREGMVGGHCMVIMDYDEQGTIELNSWGRDWGNDGTAHVPWEYVLNPKLCSDFWVFYNVEG
jgi:hypothetical protein